MLAVVGCALVAGMASGARADGRRENLGDAAALVRACRASEEPGPRTLYVVRVAATGFALAEYDADEGFLPVDTRRNVRAFGGSAELLPARLESIGFVVSPRRARELRAVTRPTLRVGFFLGMDRPGGTSCLVRGSAGITTVRMDVAFVELLDARGRVLARDETDRLRAWQDDEELDSVAGEGPRGALEPASRSDGAGTAPDAWQRAIGAANRGPVAAAIGRCHRDGVARGAPDGRVVVRVVVESRSGAVRSSEVELSSLGDAEEADCIARAVSRLTFPPDTSAGASMTISVPVRLVR